MPRAAALVAGLPAAAAHFGMNKPASWVDPEGTWGMSTATARNPGGWRSAGCTGEPPPAGEEDNVGCITQWYTNNTFIPGEPTLADDSPFLSYPKAVQSNAGFRTGTRRHPWRAPGTAPIASPCGVDGGNPDGCPAGNPAKTGCAGGGYGRGPDMRSLKKGNTKPAEWKAGGVVEVAFGVTANHGGGYQYRLCPKPAAAPSDPRNAGVTEDCFQRSPLDFHGDTQWVQYGADEANRTAFPAVRTRDGTFPKGSQWTRNPIPACGTADGGAATDPIGFCSGAQFPPPAPGVVGFYAPTNAYPWRTGRAVLGPWSVVDTLQVPKGIAPGDYALSFRIDCEQTSQVWNQCADVHISAAD